MKEALIRAIAGAMLAAAAGALMPENGIKKAANRLIALAVTASVLVPLLALILDKA